MAGYSGTPLPKKLGIKAGSRVLLRLAPKDFDLGDLPDGAMALRSGKGPFDVIVLFAKNRAALEKELVAQKSQLVVNGGLWVGWPKKASGVPTDLDEGIVRNAGLGVLLVDNKICAIDETWSGLRFVYRLRDRAEVASQGCPAPSRTRPSRRRP